MEDINSAETLDTENETVDESGGSHVETVRRALIEAASSDLTRESFDNLAKLFTRDRKIFDALKDVLEDFEPIVAEIGSKTVPGVLQGYCLLLTGRLEAAEEVLKGVKRHEWGLYHYARYLMDRGRRKEANSVLSDGHGKFADFLPITYLLAECHCRRKEADKAESLIESCKQIDPDSPYISFTNGILEETKGNYREAIDLYRDATKRNEEFQEAYFRLAYLLDLHGSDADEMNEEAVACYERCVKLEPIHTNAVINLGLLYEDRERYHDAIKCYQTVLKFYPTHARARMFLGDAEASTRMFYDKDQEKKADRQSQVLKIPVTDFELSVRSRNCLQKMNIKTLGDLIMKTEQELLSYKNFGETSLDEIKVMLSQKGLRLGQGLDEQSGEAPTARNPLEATASPDVLERSIDELELSVRSRRCMERLGVRSVRELINKTEVELMAAKNFGMTSLNEIKRKLTELGLALRG